MNLKAIALATILGFSAPAIADLTLNTPVVAQSNAPIGMYSDGEWSVSIDYYENALSYYGTNLRTGDSLTLQGARVSGTPQRRIYTWTNGDFRYQVAWQPRDPGAIRVQVFNGRGQEILNRLLYGNYD
ncbi:MULTISPECIES: hypothetical protein [unclassified Coleofasciculus]|uniref:hypothetical protein n=1 Tax=unclassified Coleofasciculus TaxID=2692782 RepID=UPI00187E7017|nr:MULTISPECIES: hypothetical protein [unclassified Coleofasciculus]MBE9127685.1 hypothetical protein [Coleofasciculus sp. LEGE 07081]MBE9151023.1 hypothetical protein [Coleofasciculus sp. LEGE 07092]